jgi:glycosyltransferase involved in cell wall biosynthesis
MPSKISIVTPSFNQANYLDQTIRSVLVAADNSQAKLEYVLIDGGSTDGSKAIIQRHASSLAWWCSEKDNGQYDAINKGFDRTTGDIMGWLNSSDLYFPWTLSTVCEVFDKYPYIQWIASLRKFCIQEDGSFEGMEKMPGFAGRSLYCGLHGGPGNSDFIQQETVFWRRELWNKIGSRIPDHCKFAADFHLWAEFFKHAPLYGVDCPLAGFRFHGDARSTNLHYMSEVNSLLSEWALSGAAKSIAPGFCTIMRRRDDGPSFWVVNRFEGEELIGLTKGLEEKLLGIFLYFYYAAFKALLLAVRTLLWPIRLKAPWTY